LDCAKKKREEKKETCEQHCKRSRVCEHERATYRCACERWGIRTTRTCASGCGKTTCRSARRACATCCGACQTTACPSSERIKQNASAPVIDVSNQAFYKTARAPAAVAAALTRAGRRAKTNHSGCKGKGLAGATAWV
jgi:hypothetical protein